MSTKTQPTHTPGPWKFYNHENPQMEFTVYAADKSEYADPGDQMVVADYLTEPNARLIAAAPDLLQAVLAMVACAEMKVEPFECLQQAREAIEMALGTTYDAAKAKAKP